MTTAFHSWTVINEADGRKTSECRRCGLVVQHSSKHTPSQNMAGRIVSGMRVGTKRPLPLCAFATKRISYPIKHAWENLGDAPPSPKGAACRAVRCTRCGVHVELLKTFRSVAAKNPMNVWRRHRMADTEEWAHAKSLPKCLLKEEDNIGRFVREHWDKVTISDMAVMLKVSKDTIRARAKAFNLRSKCTAGGDRVWTEHEDQMITWHFGVKSAKLIAKELDRSYNAIIRRAYKLGLVKHGSVQGYECLEQASKRTGYNIEQLRRMIKGRNIIPRKVEGYVEARVGKIRRRLYSVDDIDECVEAWHETETFTNGCIRLGVDPHAMKKMLSRIGVEKPSSLKGMMWRVPTEKLEEAAELHRSLISPGEYARINNIQINTLLRKLKKAGLEKPYRSSVWYLPKAVIEDAIRKFPTQRKYTKENCK